MKVCGAEERKDLQVRLQLFEGQIVVAPNAYEGGTPLSTTYGSGLSHCPYPVSTVVLARLASLPLF